MNAAMVAAQNPACGSTHLSLRNTDFRALHGKASRSGTSRHVRLECDWHKLDWRLPNFVAELQCGIAPTGNCVVSWWEWVKLIGTALLISGALTMLPVALLWFGN